MLKETKSIQPSIKDLERERRLDYTWPRSVNFKQKPRKNYVGERWTQKKGCKLSANELRWQGEESEKGWSYKTEQLSCDQLDEKNYKDTLFLPEESTV